MRKIRGRMNPGGERHRKVKDTYDEIQSQLGIDFVPITEPSAGLVTSMVRPESASA